jgi:hypothetical protein
VLRRTVPRDSGSGSCASLPPFRNEIQRPKRLHGINVATFWPPRAPCGPESMSIECQHNYTKVVFCGISVNIYLCLNDMRQKTRIVQDCLQSIPNYIQKKFPKQYCISLCNKIRMFFHGNGMIALIDDYLTYNFIMKIFLYIKINRKYVSKILN